LLTPNMRQAFQRVTALRVVAFTSLRAQPKGPSTQLIGLFSALHLSSPARTMGSATRLLSLTDIADNPGARKKRMVVCRGPGSGRGKTAGRGHKGTLGRGHLKKRGFEGGQTPLWKRTPKYGAKNVELRRELEYVNLGKVHQWVKLGRLDPTQTITMKLIRDCGLLGNVCPKWGIKLLAKGSGAFWAKPMPLTIEVTEASEKAVEAVEAAGGKVKKVWFSRVAMRAHFKPHKYPIAIKHQGIPPQKKRARYREYMEEYLEANPQYKDKLWMPPLEKNEWDAEGVESVREATKYGSAKYERFGGVYYPSVTDAVKELQKAEAAKNQAKK